MSFGYLGVSGAAQPVIQATSTVLSQSPYLAPDQAGDSYEWYLNGALYSTASTITPGQEGSYTLIIIQGACVSEESEPVVIVNDTGVTENNLDDDLSIYPNPAHDFFIISTSVN